MNNQVLSIEQVNHLMNLGFNLNDAKLWWHRLRNSKDSKEIIVDWFVSDSIEHNLTLKGIVDIIPTYTLYDLIMKLPKSIDLKDGKALLKIITNINSDKYSVVYEPTTEKCVGIMISDENLLNAVYSMLVILINRKIIPTTTKKYIYCCSQCGGSNIMILDWVDPNTNQYIGGNDDNEGWCEDCEENTKIKVIEV